MRFTLVALLLVIATIIVFLPAANALIPRMDFNDNHYTYRSLGGPKVCGDHLCKSGQWDKWISKLMHDQIKKNNTLEPNSKTSKSSTKNTSYHAESVPIVIADSSISRINTFDMGDGEFTSVISISNDGNHNINHIVVSQLNPDVKILRAWLNPDWQASKTLYRVTLDSSLASLVSGQTVNMVIMTDGKPAFSLDMLATR